MVTVNGIVVKTDIAADAALACKCCIYKAAAATALVPVSVEVPLEVIAATAAAAEAGDQGGSLAVQISHSSGWTSCSGLQGTMVNGLMSFGHVTFA